FVHTGPFNTLLALTPRTGVFCPQQRCAMLRREFLRKTATGMGAAWLSSTASLASVLAFETPARKFNAHDDVVLGKTGIRTSRLAMGTGTIGFAGDSNQTPLGMSPFAR